MPEPNENASSTDDSEEPSDSSSDTQPDASAIGFRSAATSVLHPSMLGDYATLDSLINLISTSLQDPKSDDRDSLLFALEEAITSGEGFEDLIIKGGGIVQEGEFSPIPQKVTPQGSGSLDIFEESEQSDEGTPDSSGVPATSTQKQEEESLTKITTHSYDDEDDYKNNSEELSPPDVHPTSIRKRKHLSVPAHLLHYYKQRFDLFSLYKRGILLDNESWYSVTPEKIAIHQAMRARSTVAIDAFCGCGGNAIQLAMTCEYVIAIDTDIHKLKYAQNNAAIYGVDDRIDFVCV